MSNFILHKQHDWMSTCLGRAHIISICSANLSVIYKPLEHTHIHKVTLSFAAHNGQEWTCWLRLHKEWHWWGEGPFSCFTTTNPVGSAIAHTFHLGMRVLTVWLSVIYFKCILLKVDNDKKDRNQTPLLTIKNLSNIAPKKQDKNFNVDKGFVNLGYNFTVKTGQKSSHLVWWLAPWGSPWCGNLIYFMSFCAKGLWHTILETFQQVMQQSKPDFEILHCN